MTSDHVVTAPDTTADTRTQFLDRHPRLPVLLLVLLPFLIHAPLWLLGLSLNPVWFFSGVASGPSLLHGSPFLDPNVGFTSQALGRLAAWDWVHGIVPWWNQYTGVGAPLAGELQPGAFFLPFTFLFLLPDGVLWQKICMQIIAGLSTYALLRELKLTRMAALMGGALYALNSAIAWTPGPAAVYCSLPFQPLLLWGIERARKPSQGAVSILAIGAAIGWSLLGGFPEPAYISGLLAMAWGVYRLFQENERWRMARRAVIGLLLGVLVAAPPLIAFVDYVQASDSFKVHTLGQGSLPWAAFSTTVIPYIYGPIARGLGSTALSGIWGSIGGYIGIPVILLAIVGLASRSRQHGLKILLLVWVLMSWAKSFGVQPVQWILNHVPLLGQAAYYRYSPPSWTFALVVLAAFGLDEFRARTPKRRAAFLGAGICVALAVGLAWPQRAFWGRTPALSLPMFVVMGAAVAWTLLVMLAAWLAWTRLQEERRRAMLALVLIVDAAACFMFPFTSAVRTGPIDLSALQFVKDRQGLQRSFSLGALEPNYGAYYKVASIDHNILPVPRLWLNYVDTTLAPGLTAQDKGVTFWPGANKPQEGERALKQYLPGYLEVGTQYLLTDKGSSPEATLSLPTPEDTIAGAKSLHATIVARLRAHPEVMRWSNAVANNPSKPAVERSLAKAIVQGNLPAGLNATETSDSGDIAIQGGQSIRVALAAPKPDTTGSLRTVGVMLGNHIPADGTLAVDVCVSSNCSSGQSSLSGASNQAYLYIPLAQPIEAPSGAPLRLTITLREGSRSLSLPLVHAPELQEQLQRANAQGHDSTTPGDALELAFRYGDPLPGIHKVFSGSQMDVWELPHPAPYFQVVQGGPCVLTPMQREMVTAQCSAPAMLLRRELYMQGWHARVNDKPGPEIHQASIFQTVELPAGLNRVQYRFVPPHMIFGWLLGLVGLAGLLWQAIVILRSRRQVDPT